VNSQYLLPCACGKKVPVEPPQAGGLVRCECGAELEVPTLLALRRLERADSRLHPVSSSTVAWGARQRIVFVGTIVCAIGLAVAIAFYATRPKKPDFTSAPPLLTLMIWESLKMGVDVPPAPRERAELADLEYHYRWVMFGLAVAVIGAGVLIGSLLVPRPPLAESHSPAR